VNSNFEVKIIGVGGGMSGVYDGEPSTSWVLVENGSPVIIFDLGLGVTKPYLSYFKEVPERIYISHNHSDHSGELPVVLAVEKAKNRKLQVYAHPEILSRLNEHRLHELNSASKNLEEFYVSKPCRDGIKTKVTEHVTIQTIQSIHSETCFGLLIYIEGKLAIGWSSDSAFSEDYYDKFWDAPIIILDGRLSGSKEHAGFEEIESYIAKKPNRKVYVLGYGNRSLPSKNYTLGYSGYSFPIEL